MQIIQFYVNYFSCYFITTEVKRQKKWYKNIWNQTGKILFLGHEKFFFFFLFKPRQNLTPVSLAFHKTLREGLPTTKTKEEELLKII